MIAKVILLLAVFFGLWTVVNVYKIVRSDRMNTRVAIGLVDGDHDLSASLPSGAYHILFTTQPNLLVAGGAPDPQLTASITTKLFQDPPGGMIVSATEEKSITFKISEQEAFHATHLHVEVKRSYRLPVFMHIAPSF